ncbi:MAG: glycosyltransferase family 39 protein [Acidimicrobiales bacterium]
MRLGHFSLTTALRGAPAVHGPIPVRTGTSPPAGRPKFERVRRALGDHPTISLAIALALVAALVLRFWTTSDLWLDEALTVNISRLPLGQIPGALRHDGAPPLYYFLLHFWMDVFGQSDLAVRSLSGIFGVMSLPLVWLCGRRLGGRGVAWAATLILAASPFAVRYATETRMYSMVIVLTLLGFLALESAWRRPTVFNLVKVAVVGGLLLLTHYWSLYLVAAVFLLLAWHAIRDTDLERRRRSRRLLVAVAASGIFFLPWLSTFLFQAKHTGTPWSQPAQFSAMVNAVSEFAGGGNSPGRALGLLFFALVGLGLFGAAIDRHKVELDLRTRPRARVLGFVTVATLVLAIVAGYITSSAYSPRYTSVIFAPFVLLVALGTAVFTDRRIRHAIVAACVVFGLAGSVANVTTNRTQAGQITRAIMATGHAGDIVAYCPDQLGPDASRLLGTKFQQVAFPRSNAPQIVNWVDYERVVKAASPVSFARSLVARAGATHAIYLVWAPGYHSYSGECAAITTVLDRLLPPPATPVTLNGAKFYEPSNLWVYRPRAPTGSLALG